MAIYVDPIARKVERSDNVPEGWFQPPTDISNPYTHHEPLPHGVVIMCSSEASLKKATALRLANRPLY